MCVCVYVTTHTHKCLGQVTVVKEHLSSVKMVYFLLLGALGLFLLDEHLPCARHGMRSLWEWFSCPHYHYPLGAYTQTVCTVGEMAECFCE